MLSLSGIMSSQARSSVIAWATAVVLDLLGGLPYPRPLFPGCPWIISDGHISFATREECEDIINKYHGIAVGDEAMLMQVRYADTPAQKELKRITAERRQFRTNEYNIGAYGTADVGIHPSIYSQTSWNRRHIAGANK